MPTKSNVKKVKSLPKKRQTAKKPVKKAGGKKATKKKATARGGVLTTPDGNIIMIIRK